MAETLPLPEFEQVQAKFDLAISLGVPPCLWIPPDWGSLIENKHQFIDTCQTSGPFAIPEGQDEKSKGEQARIKGETDRRKSKVTGNEAYKLQQNPVMDLGSDEWPHWLADTSHHDESEFSKEDLARVQTRLKGEDLLERLNRIIGPVSPGMKRLERIFEWALCRITVLLGELNKHGVKQPNEAEYDEARWNYIHFLRDLDDHEPEKGPKRTRSDREQAELEKAKGKVKEAAEKEKGRPAKIDPTKKEEASGYGRAIKWACIDPVIVNGAIVGVRVVAKWNPHISSSGIPIAHKPIW